MQNARRSEESVIAWIEPYRSVRQRSLQLIEPLSAEDCQIQSMPDVSPAKWHLAHTTWFFETFVLAECDAAYTPFDPQFAVLFNSYYNSVGQMHPRPRRGLLSRPSLDRVVDYRRHVDEAMATHAGAIDAAGLVARVTLGLHHEQQHQELMLTDILHVLSCNPLAPAYAPRAPVPVAMPQAQQWREVVAGLYQIGHDGEGFAFDNETPMHRVWLDSFEIAERPVSNGEYRTFVEAGGYDDPLLWLSDGWVQRQAEGWTRPMYWQADLQLAFGLNGLHPIHPDAPVCNLSYYEADAYARWAGARLPSEAEWEVAMRDGSGAERSAGQVWEWTRSAYDAYPGFAPSAGALGEYNGKFMCNQFVLRGSSVATAPGHSRPTYRNFFPPSARWQFSGLRLARDC